MDSHHSPLLTTKLNAPISSSDIMARARLLERLEQAPLRPLTLVSAPAGYGKSTLVSSWQEICNSPFAWLSLDEQDNEPRRFLSYLIAAVQTIDKTSCTLSSSILEAQELAPAAILASYLANDLEEVERHFVLVIDDYHRIHHPTIHAVLDHLVQHPPRRMHLVLVTRSDPPLPLAKLRASAGVVEIREIDLRFNRDETRDALQLLAGLAVSDGTLTHLHSVLEGWIVGLRLVCLALRHQKDPEGYLGTLRGGPTSIERYLLEEVLRQQSPAFQRCLLYTSILNRFCAPLCEALCLSGARNGNDPNESPIGGQEFLLALEHANLFAIRLSERGDWLRYHHQFQQLLQSRLEHEATPEEIAELHDRAGAWFEEAGYLDEAIDHMIRAGNVDRAARLVENHRVQMLNDDKWYVLEQWLEMLPESIRQERFGLLLAAAWSAYERFQFDRLALILETAKPLIEEGETGGPDFGEYLLLQGELHYWSGQGEKSRQLFEAARAELPERHGLVRGLLELQHGLALCMDGEKERAAETLKGLVQESGTAEGIYLSRLIAGLYFVHHLSGNLRSARMEAIQLRAVAKRTGIVYTDVWSSYMEACSHLHTHEQDQALAHWEDVARQRYILHSRAASDALAGLALSQFFLGQPDAATDTSELLHGFALELTDPQHLAIAQSSRARLDLLEGNLDSAMRWATSVEEISTPSGLFMWLEVPAITQARVLISGGTAGHIDRALDLLGEVRGQSEACCFVNQTLEVAVLQSLALEKLGRQTESRQRLTEAVRLAEAGGWIRPFVEVGEPMTAMLAQLEGEEVNARFLTQLRLALQRQGDPAPTVPPRDLSSQPLIEALTNRELDVLELLAQRLYDKEIAKALFISVGTVKSHLKHIYAKLDAKNRRVAVRKARQLGILG